MKTKRPNVAAVNAAQALAQLETTTVDLRDLLICQTVNALPDAYRDILATTLDSPTESVDVMILLQCQQNYAAMLLNELRLIGLLTRTSRVENGARCYVYTLTHVGKLIAKTIVGTGLQRDSDVQ